MCDERGGRTRPMTLASEARPASGFRRVRPHAAAVDRGRAVRARRDDAVQGRDRRRRRGRPARRLLPSGPPAGLRLDPRPLRARRAGRRRDGVRRAHPQRPARARGRRAVPAHAHLARPHRGQRRLLRRRSSPSAPRCAASSSRAPASSRWGTRRRPARPTSPAPSTTSSTARRPRSTRSPSGAPSEDYVHIETLLQPTLDEIDKITSTGGIGTGIPTGFHQLDEYTNGLHPGQMITVAGTTRHGQVDARPGLRALGRGQERQAARDLLPRDVARSRS